MSSVIAILHRSMAWGARADQAGLVSEDDELRPVTGAELDHRTADVGLDGGGDVPAYQPALAAGFDRAFLVASGIALLILVIDIAAIRVRRADLSGPGQLAMPAGNEPVG